VENTRTLLRKYRIVPQKRYGQSFLTDHDIMSRIVRLAALKKDDTVVEIGAGLGVMTTLLAMQAGKVIAIEIDEALIHVLRTELQVFNNVEINHQDIIKYDFSCISPTVASESMFCKRIKIVGNIPYNISSQILFHLIHHRDGIESMILMFQREVARRLIAEPGTKEYGILSILINLYAIASEAMTVAGDCFYPKPRVESSVVKIVFRDLPAVQLTSDDYFLRLVKAAFSQRRKTLINNLKRWCPPGLTDRDLADALERASIDGMRRGETLSVAEFGRLSNFLFERQLT
jgi:16S rRNA (adenine1518-N6/adenine1519-N6)-dimethyltransferase